MKRGSSLVGLIGEGIGASRTPAMHETEARRQGHSLVYRLIDTGEMGPDVPDLTELLHHARHFGFSGLNITYPYKQAIVPLLDEVADVARSLNAVNTVVMRRGRLSGYNTDYWGFRESFQSEMKGELRSEVLLLGAGGAGAAVAHGLMDAGVARLSVHDVDEIAAEQVAESINRKFGAGRAAVVPDVEAACAGADGIVNATPVGMAKLPGTPIPTDWLKPGHWVVDVIYFPMETAFLKAASALGCHTANGSGMAVWQAVRAFEHFTGLNADPAAMKRTFDTFGG